MNKKLTDSIEDVFEEFEKDPEFQKADRKIKPFYDLLLQIIKRRNKLGLTQKELAERANTYQSRISKIESGEYDVRLSTLIQIAEALDTSVEIHLVPFKETVFSSVPENYQFLLKLHLSSTNIQNFSEGEEQEVSFEPVYA